MALHSGTRLGPYEILTALGVGGMGEVYKARDTRLDRTVAIKVLPAQLADDPQFRDRFDREARTISQLDHPHICTLHDVGEQDGTSFLVMQYLEGETLESRLKKGALPLDQALQYAIQIADALDKAHRAGIVHRDLKPGNIMLTKAGAKLLDFGLAKSTKPVGAGAGLSMLPTTPPGLTAQGTILGTFQYMAPEQLEGQEADARTDIFAFGTVVYEMLTGKKAFEGKSQASLIAAILEREPPPVSAHQPLTPAAVERLVKTCLAKNPDKRWQTAADLKRELKWMAESGHDVSAHVATRRRGYLTPLIASLLSAMLAGLAVWVLKLSLPGSSADVARVLVGVAPADHLPARPRRRVMALSPDGEHLVFLGIHGEIQQLYLRALNRLEAVPIAGTDVGATAGARVESPFFSPDGKWIGFWVGSDSGGALKKVPLDGGPATILCPTPALAGVSWSAQDAIVFANDNRGGLWRVSASGGTPQPLTTVDAKKGEVSHRFPQILPGGQVVLFTVQRTLGRWEDAQIVAKSITTGAQRVLVQGGADARYLPTGHLVYARTGTLMAIPFDPTRLEVLGGAVTVVDDVMQAIDPGRADGGTGAAQFSVAASGALAYLPGGIDPEPDVSLVWVDRSGDVESLAAPQRYYLAPRLSPDGKRVAIFTGARDQQVWIYDIARGSMMRLTTNEPRPYQPIWTPDATRVVFGVGAAGNLFWKPWDSSGPVAALTKEENARFFPSSWSPDGKHLAFVKSLDTGKSEIWILSLDGDHGVRPFLQTTFRSDYPEFSPDGRWLAYASDESGSYEVYALPFPGPGGRRQISTEGGRAPVWARGVHQMFYTVAVPSTNRSKVMAVDVKTGPTFTVGKPRTLFEGEYRLTAPTRGYDVTPDGRRFLMVRFEHPPSPPPSSQIVLVLNWFQELRARVPTK